MELIYIFSYLIGGSITGFISGLLGVGGGLMLVPLLTTMFSLQAIGTEANIHFAISSSLAITIGTTSSAAYFYYKKKSINFRKAYFLGLSMAVGTLAGSFILPWTHQIFLKMLFAVFTFSLAIRLIYNLKTKKEKLWKPNSLITAIIGISIGILCSLLGVTGGAIAVPFLLKCGYPMPRAVGTAVACGFFVAIIGTFGAILNGIFLNSHIRYSWGYLHIPTIFSMLITSSIFAPIGAHYAYKLPTQYWKGIYAAFLLLISIRMVYQVIYI